MNIEKTILMRKHLKRRLATRSIVILALTFIALSALTYTTTVRQLNGDSALSLLVSRAIIEEGSIKLDKHRDMEHYEMVKINGNHYDYFPLGTPVLSVPAVFVMDKLGIYGNVTDLITKGQIIIMTLLNPVIFILLFLLGRRFVPNREAFVISLVCFLGSPLTSALNTALWSHTYALIISLIVILQLARYETDDNWKPNPFVIGVLLFLAYFTRPVFSVFILAVLGYLISRDRNLFIRTAGISLCLLVAFSLFSYFEYGMALPPYYISNMGNDKFITALYGVLLSPSRGLFVFMPFLLAVMAGAVYFRRNLRGDRLFLFALGFVTLNIISVSLSTDWSGGHSFGPRLLVDSMPAWALMTFIIWMYVRENIAGRHRRMAGWAWLTLGALAVWIHSWQGLHNEWALMWNMYPPIGRNVQRIVFDWRHPQMFSTANSVRDKLLWYYSYKGHDVVIDHDKGILVDFDLTRAEGYVKRGKYHLSSGREDQALEDFDRAISLSPMEPEALYSRGHIRLKRGQNENAIEDFTTSLVYNSANVQAHVDRGMAYDKTGQYGPALADYVKAISLADPDDKVLMKSLYLRRGIDHFRTGEHNMAISDLIIAIERGNSTPEAYHHIAAAYYASRRYYDAVKAYTNIISLYPRDEKARLMLLNSMRKDADTDTGATLNDHKDFVISTPSRSLIRAISRHYLGMEAREEKEIILEAENSGDAALMCDTYYLLAEQRLMHGFTVGARKLLKKGEKTCPKDIPEYYLNRSLLNWLGR
jgi:tetratricopeptide (TPR) repeat protein